MRVIFCADPLDGRYPDPAYDAELEAVQALGLSYDIVQFETLTRLKDAARAVARVKPGVGGGETAVYRGWMLTPSQYTELYDMLLDIGLILLNTPGQYRHTHYLPESYSAIQTHTPQTVWLPCAPEVPTEAIMGVLRPFGNKAVIVKDYVKSQKYYWNDAFYIPDASATPQVERVVRRFIELQGDSFSEGLVFREYMPFVKLAANTPNMRGQTRGLQFAQEFRLFALDSQPMLTVPYWDEAQYPDEALPSLAEFEPLLARVNSRFFTMDIARLQTGAWMVIELGDGQVAGVPTRADLAHFYQRLAATV
jgi:hypothetical protein